MSPPESEKRPRSVPEATAAPDAPNPPPSWDPEVDPDFDPELDPAPMRRPPLERPDVAAALAVTNDEFHWVGDVQPSEEQAYLKPTTMPRGLVAPTLDMASIVVREEPDARRAAARDEVVSDAAVRDEDDDAIEAAPESKWARDVKVPALDRAALPSSHAPSSRPPPSAATVPMPGSTSKPAEKRRAWVPVAGAVAAVAMTGVLVGVATRGSGEASETTGADGPQVDMAIPSGRPVAIASSAPTASEVPSAALPAVTGARPTMASASATTSATTLASPPTSAVKPAPKATVDSYADAGALPSANGVPSVVPSAALTIAPIAPSGTASASTSAKSVKPLFKIEKD